MYVRLCLLHPFDYLKDTLTAFRFQSMVLFYLFDLVFAPRG